ncbi:MAG TPA: hypothetical protein DCY80_20340, partial [Solibacterales bacterium]|nr:hypothetical protein [Bryobacterales bacterium]
LRGVFGSFLYSSGQPDAGLAAARAAVEQARRQSLPEPRIATLQQLADMESAAGRCDAAMALQNEARDLVQRHARRLPPSIHAAALANRAASLSICQQDRPGALALTSEAVALLPRIGDTDLDIPMPPRLFKSLLLSLHAHFLSGNQRIDEARVALNHALEFAGPDPSTRITILRARAALEYSDANLPAAAAALEQAAQLAPGVASPFEELRLRVMWARRLAETPEKARAAQIILETLAESERRAAEIGPLRWMILADASMALFNAGECTRVLELGREIQQSTNGRIPPQWRGNQAAAEGLCLMDQGRPAEARPRLEQALQDLGPILPAASTWRRRIEAALENR